MSNQIPDGLNVIAHAMPSIMEIIADTARWVHPEIFHALPVWRPETARKQPLYKADWVTRQMNKGELKAEGNVAAQWSLMTALGVSTGSRPKNWTTCHIWGYDDPSFAGGSVIVQDRRYFSCVGNMVLLPTPLKGFTDAVPEIKRHLRVCAYNLYDWVCEHEAVAEEARIVRWGAIPDGYPPVWPTPDRRILPPGTGPASAAIAKKAADQKRKIAGMLSSNSLTHYPRDEVQKVLDFWGIDMVVSRT